MPTTSVLGPNTDELGGWRWFLRQLGETLLFCAGLAVVLTLIFAAFLEPSWRNWLGAFMVNMVISTSIGLSLSGVYTYLRPPLARRFPGRWASYLIHLVIVVLGVSIGVEVALRVIALLGGPEPSAMRADVFRIGLVVSGIIVIVTVSFERLRKQARATELRAQQAQKEALRAQLETLQARTNPHFLFNSLNTVAGLIDEDPSGAERVLEKLSSLFRYSLEGSKTEWVRLERELDAVNAYLEVEHIRLGDRLHSSVEVDPGVAERLVPPLVLQPLVENAVLHAVAPRKEGGRLEIRVGHNGSGLELSVTDDGPGLGNSVHRGSGTSLGDLRRRLEMLYGERALLETTQPEGGGCRVTVTLPSEAGDLS